MKLIIVLAAVTLAHAATLDRAYLPPNAQGSAGTGNFPQIPHHSAAGIHGQNTFSNGPASNAYPGATSSNTYAQNGYSGVQARAERPQAAFERNAAILRQDYTNNGHSYSYAYETQNGIRADESGIITDGTQAQGSFAYTGDDGKIYSVRYTADVNGFVPQGDHLPTPPPIPEEILKALAQNARDEAAGIYDDGLYSEAKYSGGSQQQYYNTNAQPINYSSNSGAVNKAYLPPHA